MALDDELLATAMELTPEQEELERLFVAEVASQAAVEEAKDSFVARRKLLHEKFVELARTGGPSATLGLRARALQRLEGGWGILLDDISAGLEALLVTHLFAWLLWPRLIG